MWERPRRWTLLLLSICPVSPGVNYSLPLPYKSGGGGNYRAAKIDGGELGGRLCLVWWRCPCPYSAWVCPASIQTCAFPTCFHSADGQRTKIIVFLLLAHCHCLSIGTTTCCIAFGIVGGPGLWRQTLLARVLATKHTHTGTSLNRDCGAFPCSPYCIVVLRIFQPYLRTRGGWPSTQTVHSCARHATEEVCESQSVAVRDRDLVQRSERYWNPKTTTATVQLIKNCPLLEFSRM